MPLYRDRTADCEAMLYTGDNDKIVEAWAAAFGVKVARFIGEDSLAVYIPEHHYWEPIPKNHYLTIRGGLPWIMERDWFDSIYEEVK